MICSFILKKWHGFSCAGICRFKKLSDTESPPPLALCHPPPKKSGRRSGLGGIGTYGNKHCLNITSKKNKEWIVAVWQWKGVLGQWKWELKCGRVVFSLICHRLSPDAVVSPRTPPGLEPDHESSTAWGKPETPQATPKTRREVRAEWTPQRVLYNDSFDVASWLQEIGLPQCIPAFEDSDVTREHLLAMSDQVCSSGKMDCCRATDLESAAGVSTSAAQFHWCLGVQPSKPHRRKFGDCAEPENATDIFFDNRSHATICTSK